MSDNPLSSHASPETAVHTSNHRGVFSKSEPASPVQTYEQSQPDEAASAPSEISVHSDPTHAQDLSAEHPALAKYADLQTIGAGGQGTMLRATAPDGAKVAIKVFDIQKTDGLKSLELFEREIDTLKNINIKGVPHFIEDIRADRYLYLIEEYIDAPSLEKRMKTGPRFTFAQIETILKNTAKILQDLSELVPPVIHRDIKPANLLVDKNLNVTLVDFGVVAAQSQETFSMTFAGTAGYLAPEQLYGKASPASDVYSLGITIVHLITGIAPCDMSIDGISLDIDKYIPRNIPQSFTHIIKKMINPKVSERLQSGKEVLECFNKPKSQKLDRENIAHPVQDQSIQKDKITLYKKFPQWIEFTKLVLLEAPLGLLVISVPLFFIINFIFIDAPLITYFTDWLPGIMPFIIAYPCIGLDPAPALEEIKSPVEADADYTPARLRKYLVFPIVTVIALIVLSLFSKVSFGWMIVYFILLAIYIYRSIRYFTSYAKYYNHIQTQSQSTNSLT